MPRPEFAGDLDAFESPHTATEILGRGPTSRKSKTLVKDAGTANVLARIAGYVRLLTEAFKRSHARHNTVLKEVEDEETGEMVAEHVPEILTDQQVRELYPIVQEWYEMHQEHVEHYASVGGFSVRAASGMVGLDREGKGSKDGGSSAGSDLARNGAGDPTAEPRWR